MQHEGRYYVMSEGKEHAHWVQNIMRNPNILFNVGTEGFAGTGNVIRSKDPPGVEIKKLMKSKYGWDSGLIVELVPD